MSNIEIFAWCSSRELFVTGMTTTTFPDGSTLATLSEDGNLIPHEGVIIDEIGPVTKADGTVIEGHHVNLMATGAIASMLTAGCPDTGTVFERTNILSLIPGMVWTPLPSEGVPSGYKGPNNVLLFDPGAVNSRSRVFL